MARDRLTLLGIIAVAALALVIDLSGSGLYTLGLWRPLTLAQGLDLSGGTRVVLDAAVPSGISVSTGAMATDRSIVAARLNSAFGVAEPVIQAGKSGHTGFISVELPATAPAVADVLFVAARTGRLTLAALGARPLPRGALVRRPRVLADGADVDPRGVALGVDAMGVPAVDVALRAPAARRLDAFTAGHAGRYLGVMIDGRVLSSEPISGALPGAFTITRLPTYRDAVALATILKYGALPVPLKIAGIQSVSASLGPANIRASILAGLVGLLIVMLFMVFYYRLPGLLADAALLIYAAVVFAIFKTIPVTLTLAGTAGFILSIGMAVDANILIFERMKEELRAGRSVGGATDAGFARAWPSIRDSNISTMITCGILYWFGSNFAASIIVGFATTLFIGVVISMLTAILVSRTFLRLVFSLE